MANRRKGKIPPTKKSIKFDPLSLMGCFNCEDFNHSIGACINPVNAVKAAKRKIEYFEKNKASRKNVYYILYQLCHQVDEIEKIGGSKKEDVKE